MFDAECFVTPYRQVDTFGLQDATFIDFSCGENVLGGRINVKDWIGFDPCPPKHHANASHYRMVRELLMHHPHDSHAFRQVHMRLAV
jgi:hypothetical protein